MRIINNSLVLKYLVDIQDPRLQGRAPGFRGEGEQVEDKSGMR